MGIKAGEKLRFLGAEACRKSVYVDAQSVCLGKAKLLHDDVVEVLEYYPQGIAYEFSTVQVKEAPGLYLPLDCFEVVNPKQDKKAELKEEILKNTPDFGKNPCKDIQLGALFAPKMDLSKIEAEMRSRQVIEEVLEKTKAARFNSGKPKFSLLNLESFTPCVRVLEFGAKKYARDNWQKGLKKSEVFDSLLRHIEAIQRGEVNCPESGLPHIGHLQCNAMFLGHPSIIDDMSKKETEVSE